jgi:putative MATE family efflux protein
MKADTIRMLAQGNMTKTLLRLCLPAVAAMTVNGIYNVVDAFFIGLTGDNGAVGAISVIFPLFIVMSAFAVGISVGAGNYVSRCLGAGDMDGASRAGGAAVIFAVLLGVITTAAALIWMEPMLRLLGAREVIMPYARAYTSWIVYGGVLTILNGALAGTIRAEGNVFFATAAMLAGTVLNILLDPLFIFVLHMGIQGAALATLISYAVTLMISVLYYVSKRAVVKLKIDASSVNRTVTGEIVKTGVPAMTKQLLLAVVFCLINALSAGYSEDAVTAAGICAKVNSFVAMTLMGIAQGFMPVAAFNYGAKNYARVRDALKKVLVASVIFAGVSAAAYLLFERELVALFCRDEAIVRIGAGFMRAFAFGLIPMAVAFLMDSFFFACGRGGASMLLSVSRQGLIFVPLVLIANAVIGLDGVAWSSAAADVLSCLCVALPLYLGFTRRIKSEPQPQPCVEQPG